MFKTAELELIRTILEPRTAGFQSLSSAFALPEGKFLPNTPIWVVGMVFFVGVNGQAIDAKGPLPWTLPQECRAVPCRHEEGVGKSPPLEGREGASGAEPEAEDTAKA